MSVKQTESRITALYERLSRDLFQQAASVPPRALHASSKEEIK